MKILILLSFILIFEVRAQTALTSEFRSLVAQEGVGPVKEQSYCYSKDGLISGYQVKKLQRIASVTKLFSTLLISETEDLHKTFTTRIFAGRDSLHIEGGQDPYFEEDKLLLLFQALNGLGYKNFKQISFNRNFHFYDIAMGSYEKITPEKTQLRLSAYTNPRNVSLRQSRWASVRKFAEEEGVLLPSKNPVITSSKVIISDSNPIKNNSVLYIHTSRPLHRLLKTMNVQSKNYVAENIYLAGLSRKSLSQLLESHGISAQTFRIYNGSGLPVVSRNSRLDNTATCETVLKVIELLSQSLKKHNLILSDVMAVNGGKDLGSFRTRFENYPETHEAVLAKTGTLKHTSSLAGFLLMDRETPFAILNHSTNSTAARNFQDRFVSVMFNFLGTASPLVYEKISIFPWDGSDFLELAY